MRVFGAPRKYIQGQNVLDRAGKLLSPLGNRFFVLGDDFVLSLVGDRIGESLNNAQKTAIIEPFGGECCYSEIDRLRETALKQHAEVIIGAGGGKAADTAKALNIELKLPVVIIPTVASTDAPTSHLAVIYDENHVKQAVLRMDAGPSLVLVDTGVIAGAPVRSLVAGMGDALSSKFEAEACWKSGARNMFGGKPCRAALALAQLSYDIIMENGDDAKKAAENKSVTPALESVIEANILLSGLGFESGGLAAIHALHGGFTMIEEMDSMLHGEKVAFATLVQLDLENRERDIIIDIIGFYKRMGLPTCLGDLGMKTIDTRKLEQAIENTCQPGSYIHNMPFKIDPQAVMDSVLKVEELGSSLP
jgi:glycerol dehydrogenase